MILNVGPAPFDYEFEFTIPEDAHNVGLFLSGGLDSSILLCMIIEELNQTNRSTLPIHIFTCNKPPDPEGAARMVDLIRKEYDRDLIYHENYNVSEEAKSIGVIDMISVKEAYDEFDGDIVIYMAGNNSWDKTRWSEKVLEQYTPHDLPRPLQWDYPEEPHIVYPFGYMLKPQMLDIYYKLNKEHLIEYAYSCSKKYYPACEVCYSCIEAEWAFKVLDKQRPDYVEI